MKKIPQYEIPFTGGDDFKLAGEVLTRAEVAIKTKQDHLTGELFNDGPVAAGASERATD